MPVFPRKSILLFSRRTTARLFRCALVAILLLVSTSYSQTEPEKSASGDDLRELVLQLRDELRQTRTELAATRGQIERLKVELTTLQHNATTAAPSQQSKNGGTPFVSGVDAAEQADAKGQTAAASLNDLSEQQKLLQAQVEELHQTKVESLSKYRVKLYGLVLMNAFTDRGGVDTIDVPNTALRSQERSGAGATLRQSLIGLQVFGPELAGAQTSAGISFDFFGGFPQQPYGTTAGIVRLRQASAHLDWANTSLTVGQEGPFISPLSPTSYATLAEPALAQSGNLWVWTPQAFLEHRLHTSDVSFFSVSGGLLATLTEDIPSTGQAVIAGPGERARRPAFASKLGWESQKFGQKLQFGIGVYTSHLKYEFGRNTSPWAVTSYWQVPIGSRLELSGEAYRGKAIGGLGGGIWQSALYNGDPAIATTTFRPLNAAGGWSQLKIRLHSKWESNFAFGQDNVLARDLRWAPTLQGEYALPMARNRTAFSNVIFRPKSNLLLSTEYRYIWTYGYVGAPSTAAQVNLGAGVSF